MRTIRRTINYQSIPEAGPKTYISQHHIYMEISELPTFGKVNPMLLYA